jgi:DNA-binding XRE family transcriptional regulator
LWFLKRRVANAQRHPEAPTLTRPTHSFRVDAETHAMLATMSRTRGVTQAALLTQLVRQEFEASPPTIGLQERERERRPVRWTPEAVIEAIQARHAARLEVTPYRMQLEDAGLWEGGCRVFGSWADALVAAGIELPPRRAEKAALGLGRMRGQKLLSQLALSKMVNVSQATISSLESGVWKPTPVLLRALARALECEPEELLRP